MKAIYNNVSADYDDLKLPFSDRGFRYGDGLFETMAVFGQNVRFLEDHYHRIQKGAELLRYNLNVLPFSNLQLHCRNLLNTWENDQHGKMKLFVWRAGPGLYSPSSDEINFLLYTEPLSTPGLQVIDNVDFSLKAINFHTVYSQLKTISAMKYVVAGLEMKDKNLDEIIIRDHEGNVSETLYSNLFMKYDGEFYTPPVTTGCVEGVMRCRLMYELRIRGYKISEKLFTPDHLLMAESVFLTNALGVKHISKIGEKALDVDMMIQRLVESLN
jgi:branched-subunit amino acid aminotransferase/4-amino-4-deoxychorismate lyase